MLSRPVGRLRIGKSGSDWREIPRHVIVFGGISPPSETPHGASLQWGPESNTCAQRTLRRSSFQADRPRGSETRAKSAIRPARLGLLSREEAGLHPGEDARGAPSRYSLRKGGTLE